MEPPPSPIGNDIPCRRCGYNLRGLDESGRCPECGTAVGLSTRGDFLCYADPNWLRRLKIGLWLMFAGVMCIVVMQLQNYVLTLRLPYVIQPFLYFGFSLITIAGVWLVTAPDPVGLAEDQYVTARKLIRIAVITGLSFRIFSLGASSTTVSPDMRILLSVLSVLSGIIGIIGDIAKFKYLAQLAGRIPSTALARMSRHLMWWYPVVSPHLVLLAFLSFTRPSTGFFLSLRWIFDLQRYLTLALLIASAVLYARMAKVVRRQEEIARQSYATAEGAVAA